MLTALFFFSSRRRHTRLVSDWSSDVCSSDLLALGYVIAVAAWLWSLRHQISGPDVSTGLLLVGAAMLLAWLAGVAGAVPGVRSLAAPRSHDGNGRGASVCHRLTDHPLAILRLGLALQFTGFLALVAIH